ncbi:MAG: HEAT repeat domain-containing protein [Elusimicrobia bacterium]|nr:HEAT repeat domain-containing protein [Elusimicrobiota bacterium]
MRKPIPFLLGSILITVGCATGRPPLKSLARQLRSPNPDVRVKAMTVLPDYGDEGATLLPAVVENFRDRREPVYRGAENALVRMKEPGAQALGSLLSDRDSWVRCRAAASLGRMGKEAVGVIPQLVESLRDSDFCVAEKSALALGAMGDAAVPALLSALKSDNAAARRGAARSLGYMSPEIHAQVAAALLPDLLSDDPFLRGETAMNVTAMGKVGVPVFLEALKQKDDDLRQRAVDGLGEIGLVTPEVVEALIGLYKDSQRTIRLKASLCLGRMGQRDESVYKAVAPGLASKDKDILLGTLRALGAMGGAAEPSLPQIVYLLEESTDVDLRNEAAEALISMGTRASLAAAERYTRGQYKGSKDKK